MLSLAIFLPLIGAVVVALGPARAARGLALAFSAVTCLVTLAVLLLFRPDGGLQFVERAPWIRQLGSDYFVAVDGLSVLFVALTGLLTLVSIGISHGTIHHRVKEYYAAFLILETGMLGVFAALDFFLFYVFWELTLIPMALLIGVWGHGRRIYSAVKFFLYTFVGSLLMLIAIIALYYQHGAQTGDYTLDVLRLAQGRYDIVFQSWVFLGLFIAFVVKVPLWPFHTWLPDAHVDAPTAGSVILAGVLLKMGGYGLLRFALPLAPDAARTYAPAAVALAVVAILYGAMVTLVQTDLKKLVAYSSVSHMGFVVLGIFLFNAQGIQGAIIQMIAHGFNTAGLFLCVGMVYERLHTRSIADLGGLATRMPRWGTVFMLFTLASLGLPGLSGFVGEFLVMLGAFRVSPWLAAVVALVIIPAAWYMLWLYQRVAQTDLFGVVGQRLDDSSAPALGLAVDRGLLVTEVVPARPAARAGIRAGDDAGSRNSYNVPATGDVLLALDDHPVSTVDEVAGIVNRRPLGAMVSASLLRQGTFQAIPVQLGGAAGDHAPSHPDPEASAAGTHHAPDDDDAGDPRVTDLSRAELAVVLPLIVLTVVVGVYAAPVFAVLNPAVDALLRQLGAGGG